MSAVQGTISSMVTLMILSLVLFNIFTRVFMKLGSINNTLAVITVIVGGVLILSSSIYYSGHSVVTEIIGIILLAITISLIFLNKTTNEFVIFLISRYTALILLQYYILYSANIYSGKSGWVEYFNQFNTNTIYKFILLYSIYSIFVYYDWTNRKQIVSNHEDILIINENIVITTCIVVIFLSWWFLQYAWSTDKAQNINRTIHRSISMKLVSVFIKLISVLMVTVLAVLLIDTLSTLPNGLVKYSTIIGVIIVSFILFIWNQGSMKVVYAAYFTIIFLIVSQVCIGIEATMYTTDTV
jgi:hypothetical protein